jgi:putative thiamine transport system ATP-binding protein
MNSNDRPANTGLSLQGLTLLLHGQPLTPAITAHVASGAVLVLMGASGSGKSSLLAHVAGLLAPPLHVQGRLHLDGRSLDGVPTEARRVGLMFQDDLLFPHLSVLENLLFAHPPGPRAARVQACEAALLQAGLAGFGARKPGSLSGGQRARVALLRALLAKPRVLLLDEPFSKLDMALRQDLRTWVFAQLQAQGVCTMLVTHDPADVPPGAACLQLMPPPAA